jgi:Mg/Co/Ni transporter MgtE
MSGQSPAGAFIAILSGITAQYGIAGLQVATLMAGVILLLGVARLGGVALPWLFDAAGADPAFGSGALATVIQDLLSILIYFAVATSVMR